MVKMHIVGHMLHWGSVRSSRNRAGAIIKCYTKGGKSLPGASGSTGMSSSAGGRGRESLAVVPTLMYWLTSITYRTWALSAGGLGSITPFPLIRAVIKTGAEVGGQSCPAEPMRLYSVTNLSRRKRGLTAAMEKGNKPPATSCLNDVTNSSVSMLTRARRSFHVAHKSKEGMLPPSSEFIPRQLAYSA